MNCDKKENEYELNFEKHASTIISFSRFLSRKCGLLYIYLYIINVFKYLFLLTENKESYLYYYYMEVVRFSLDPLSCSSSLLICCCKIIV